MNQSSVFKILVIGCGDLGSRHIQGLLKSQQNFDILAFDKSAKSIAKCRERLTLEKSKSEKVSIQYTDSLAQHSGHWDLVIVATTSMHRLIAVTEMVKYISYDYLILEKLVARNIVELQSLASMLSDHSKVWVNCPRRTMDWYKLIKLRLVNEFIPSRLEVNIGGHELATNLIHFMDLASWLFESAPLECFRKTLSQWQESKRDGFYDLSGNVSIKYKNGCELFVSCVDQIINTSINIYASISTLTISIDEINGCAVLSNGSILRGTLDYQSSLTGKIADSILTTGSCSLPDLNESYAQHIILFEIFEDHWKSTFGSGIDALPRIT